jgi:hypothetical protein
LRRGNGSAGAVAEQESGGAEHGASQGVAAGEREVV